MPSGVSHAKDETSKVISFLSHGSGWHHYRFNWDHDENEASKSVRDTGDKHIIVLNKLSQANWNYVINLTTANAIKKKDGQLEYADFAKPAALRPLNYHVDCFRNETLRRIIKRLTSIGDAIPNEGDFNEFKEAIMRMEANYATATVPSYNDANKPVRLEPEITKVFGESRDFDEPEYYWVKWHDLT